MGGDNFPWHGMANEHSQSRLVDPTTVAFGMGCRNSPSALIWVQAPVLSLDYTAIGRAVFEEEVRDGADNSPWHGREMKKSKLILSHWSLVQAGVGVPTSCQLEYEKLYTYTRTTPGVSSVPKGQGIEAGREGGQRTGLSSLLQGHLRTTRTQLWRRELSSYAAQRCLLLAEEVQCNLKNPQDHNRVRRGCGDRYSVDMEGVAIFKERWHP